MCGVRVGGGGGGVRAGRFDPEVFVNCLQNAVLLVKSHVNSRNAAMSLYQINEMFGESNALLVTSVSLGQ